MRLKLGYLLLFIVLLTACSNNEQSSNGVQGPTKKESKEEEEQIVQLKENEVKAILKENLDSIFDVFVSLGEEHNWNNGNQADFNKIKPNVLSFSTEEFANSTLKSLSNDFYCECDQPFKPNLDYDVRFSFEQSEDDVIKIKALESATEMNNMGSIWEFELMKEADKWKINQWNAETLEGKDIQLTKEEAEKLLKDEEFTPEFVKRYQSEEASGKAYFFTIKSSQGEGVAAISSKDTHFVYDFEKIKTNQQQADNESVYRGQQKEEAPTPQTPVKEDIQEESDPIMSRKAEYLEKLSQIKFNEKSVEVSLDYRDDYQMFVNMQYNNQLWDDALNEIYGVLKTQLSESEMNHVRNEQRQWITDRDTAAQAAYDGGGGGSWAEIAQVDVFGRLTKERCYELVNSYMK